MQSEDAKEILFFQDVPVAIKVASSGLAGYATPSANIPPSPLSSSLLSSQGLSPQHTSQTQTQTTQSSASETRKKTIQVQVSRRSSLLPNGQRVKFLDIRLTDESDPYFLYQLGIAQEDFHSLRLEQNLLVDFIDFPVKLIELLEECQRASKDENPKYGKHSL
jgi:hypothetical protein